MDTNPYRVADPPRAAPLHTGDRTLRGPILWLSGLLFGFCILRVACGLREEGWIFERWVALGFALWLAKSLFRSAARSRREPRP
jgi:hypothetical protein